MQHVCRVPEKLKMSDQTLVTYRAEGAVAVVTIERPEVRNAVDQPTRLALIDAFRRFDAEPIHSVAILTGAGGAFCAGADLKAFAAGKAQPLTVNGDAPMGPTGMTLSKPVIAAIEGAAVAGGLELALWCDLRVAARNATLGVYCRRFGVPLIDLGTIRLPRLIGHSRAMDLILTGRGVSGEEAERIGLVNRVAEPGDAVSVAMTIAQDLARLPQTCLRNDRLSAIAQWDLDWEAARANEFRFGMATIASGEAMAGATRFAGGQDRQGAKGSAS
jgi:enoyl-CoA hydratase